MSKLKLDFKSLSARKKNLKYGGYSTILTVVVAAILVVAVVACELLNFYVDITANKLFTISDATKGVVESLKDDVGIYGMFQTGTEQYEYYADYISMVQKLVEQYANVCSHIEYKTIDTLKNPDFVKQYISEDSGLTTIPNGSFLIVNKTNNKYRLLSLSDFYDFSDNATSSPDLFAAEEATTTAIQYVVSGETPIMYEMIGHGEIMFDETFKSYVNTTNYDFQEFSLVGYAEETIPVTNHTVICINSPQTDLNEDEYEMLLDYMERGGRMLALVSPGTEKAKLPNFCKLLARFGVSFETDTGYIGETDANKYYKAQFNVLNTLSKDSDITKDISSSNVAVLTPFALPLYVGESTNPNTKWDIFMQTSETSRLYTDPNYPGQIGPFITGVAVSEEKTLMSGVVETKLVVLGNDFFIDASNDPYGGLGLTTSNFHLAASVLNYLQDGIGSLYITSKTLSPATFTPTTGGFLAGLGFFCILLPVALIVTGIVIWRKRKNL